MKNGMIKNLILFLSIFVLAACNLPSRQSPQADATKSTTDLHPTSAPTPVSTCNNQYFPNREGTRWEYAGNNSVNGAYTRSDTVSSTTVDSFTVQSTFADTTYSVGYTCSAEGLTVSDPIQQYMGALLSSPDFPVSVKLNSITGITLPTTVKPGDTWQQTANWEATGANISVSGRFVFNYAAVGYENITVPYGSYNALRVDANISIKVSPLQISYGSYNMSLWLAPDIGVVKSEGTSYIRGVDFSDSTQLTAFTPAP